MESFDNILSKIEQLNYQIHSLNDQRNLEHEKIKEIAVQYIIDHRLFSSLNWILYIMDKFSGEKLQTTFNKIDNPELDKISKEVFYYSGFDYSFEFIDCEHNTINITVYFCGMLGFKGFCQKYGIKPILDKNIDKFLQTINEWKDVINEQNS